MLLSIAARNFVLNLKKRLLILSVIAVSMAMLLFGNSILLGSSYGIKRTYCDNFTGDFSVTAITISPFTLFGNEMPLVGEYEVMPALPEAERVGNMLRNTPGVAEAIPIVSSAALLQVAGVERATPLFGVDFTAYFSFFSQLRVVAGKIPTSGKPALMLNAVRLKSIETQIGRQLVVGEPILLVVYNNSGFTLREVPFSGAWEYPVRDDMLDRVALVDVNTARSLNGYVYGAERTVVLPTDKTVLLGQDDDDVFASAEDVETAPAAGIDLVALEAELAKKNVAVQTVDGAWNHWLVRVSPGNDPRLVQLRVEHGLDEARIQARVKDWRATAGGNASIIYFLSVFFNVGMAFVTGIAVFVVANSLALSVRERSKEIGTMRALGASRSWVAGMLAVETLIVVAGAAAVGLAGGLLLLVVVADVGIPLLNPLLVSLFGGAVLRPVPDAGLVLAHFVVALGVGLLAWVVPVRVALGITPIRAIMKD